MEKAFDISMIASFVPTLLGYLPVTLYIGGVFAVRLSIGAAFGAAPHLSHSRFESVCEAVYLFFQRNAYHGAAVHCILRHSGAHGARRN